MNRFGRDIANLIGSFLGPSKAEVQNNMKHVKYWLNIRKPLTQLGKADCIQIICMNYNLYYMIMWVQLSPLS